MRAARAEQKRKTWVRQNAALFADNLETQLARSLKLVHQEDGAPLMYISPADLTALREEFCTCKPDNQCPGCREAAHAARR
jgi:hypothetical protein